MDKKNYIHQWIDHKRHNKRACGICHSQLHPGLLTVKMVKEHRCLAKNCHCLQKFEEHPYWEQRRKAKAFREEKKKIRQEENRKYADRKPR